MDWILPENPGFRLGSDGEHNVPQPSASESPSRPMESCGIVRITSDSHFSSLSRINKELHAISERMSRQTRQGTLDSFVVDTVEHNGATVSLKPYQYLMKVSQDYLQVIKSLHRSLDTNSRIGPMAHSDSVDQSCFALTIHPSLASTTNGSNHDATQSDPSSEQLILDSSTALLVISCFSQLLRHLEAFFAISQARLRNPFDRPIASVDESFAGVSIVDFLTQCVMFFELIRNVFGQTIVILGLPTGTWWCGKTMWAGLLTEQRYRDMLNQELGAVENGWSTRPSKFMETVDACRTAITDASMSGWP